MVGATEELNMIKTNTGLIYWRIFQWKSIDRGSNATVITKKMKTKLMALFSRGMLPGNRTPGSLRNCECTFFFFCASAWQGALFVYGLTLNWIYSFSFLSHWLFQRLQVSVNLWTVLFFPVSGDFVETNQGFSLKFLTNYLTFTQYMLERTL